MQVVRNIQQIPIKQLCVPASLGNGYSEISSLPSRRRWSGKPVSTLQCSECPVVFMMSIGSKGENKTVFQEEQQEVPEIEISLF